MESSFSKNTSDEQLSAALNIDHRQAAAPASRKTKKARECAGRLRRSAGGRRVPLRTGSVLSSTIFSTSPFSFTDLDETLS